MQYAASTAEKVHASREKVIVASASLLAAAVLTLAKLVVGLWTHSLGVLSEAAHSLLDLIATSATLWAVRMSARPADRRHTYGYGKFEDLSALVVTASLLILCAGIVYEAVERLGGGRQTEVDPSVWAFLVVLLSMAVDCWRSRALLRVARKYHSRALEADALHFATDIWSSAVVFLGLAGVLAAKQLDQPWLARADTLAALAVAAIIVTVSLRMGKKSVDDLSDRIPEDLHDRLAEAAGSVPGVQGVSQIRMRRSGAEVFADMTLSVAPAASFQQAHDIADRAAEAVRSVIPGADVVVHTEPAGEEELDLTTHVRVLAARHGLAAHAIRFYAEGRRRRLELHLEVRESLSLEEAHRQASEFERDVRTAMPDLAEVVSHLEPAGDATAWIEAEPADEAQVHEALDAFFHQNTPAGHVHQVKVLRAGGELLVSFHCRLDPATAITDAHELTVRVEEFLRRRIPSLARVVVHVEPRKTDQPDARSPGTPQ
jgi:cation diffusion facilitator family transporter